MRVLAWRHQIRLDNYNVRSEQCYKCLRFIKNELKVRSPLFCRLNDIINPHFNRIRNGLLTPEEIAEAKDLSIKLL